MDACIFSRSPRGGPSRHGFTLIEVLIVVVIVAILAAIAIPKFSESRGQAFRSSMMADLRNLGTLQELYYEDKRIYADDFSALDAVASSGVTIDVTESSAGGWAATARHRKLSASDACGVFHGDAAAGVGNPATREGLIACSF